MTKEEAIRRIKAWNLDEDDIEVLAEIIPELKESENERIISAIIDALNSHTNSINLLSSRGYKMENIEAYLEKQKDASKAMEAVDRIDKYIDDHLANAHDMKDSNPDKKYYRGWDDALGKMAGILQDVYSEKENKFAPRVLPCSAAWFEDGDEKQKEPLPIPDKFSGLKSLMLQYLQSAANRKDDAEIEDDTDLWGRKILDYVWKYEETQKEQKPVEYLSKRQVYNIMNKLTELSMSNIIPMESEEYSKIHEITSDVCSLLDYPIEQKEQKPNLYDMGRWDEESYNNGIYHVLMNPEAYGLMKHKPSEWSANDKAFIKDCARILDEDGYTTSAERLLLMFPINPSE